MIQRIPSILLAGLFASGLAYSAVAKSFPDKVVIIRHGEKPDDGDNLSCQGQNRALRLPGVLYPRFPKPDRAYVPALDTGKETKHARMFQTVSPFAIQHNLTINSQFDVYDYGGIADDVRGRGGTVLLVWEHKAIPHIAKKLGVDNPPEWKGGDFDGIWVIIYDGKGTASLSVEREGLNPSPDCRALGSGKP